MPVFNKSQNDFNWYFLKQVWINEEKRFLSFHTSLHANVNITYNKFSLKILNRSNAMYIFYLIFQIQNLKKTNQMNTWGSNKTRGFTLWDHREDYISFYYEFNHLMAVETTLRFRLLKTKIKFFKNLKKNNQWVNCYKNIVHTNIFVLFTSSNLTLLFNRYWEVFDFCFVFLYLKNQLLWLFFKVLNIISCY